MKIVKRKITELIAAEYNPRKINKVQEQDLKDSLTRFGLVDPIIININEERKNIVIGGHQRLRVWADLGNTEIDCNQLDLTLDKERELNIRLNKNGGSFDDELIKEYFDYEELTEWGFTPDELFDKEETTADGLIDDDEIPEAKDSKVKRGDIWKLGKHRIMCGDSTSLNDVEKLMNGEKANMVFTDPPYNVGFNGRSGKFDVIKNDDLKEKDFNKFINEFANTLHILDINIKYIWCNWKFYDVLKCKFNFNACIVWAKNVFGLGRGYRHQHEFCLFEGKLDDGINNESDLWNIAKDSKYVHPTQKPIALAERAFGNHKSAINVLDLFLGSGSTLIAAEKLNRKCYGMELDEKYCDVIIERWEQFTGLKAEKING
jgi:DNA modification methylase